MPDDQTRDAAGTALGALAGSGALGALGVWLLGLLNGSSKQSADLNKRLTEENARLIRENERLRTQASLTIEWKSLCLDARREARAAGYTGQWPDDPEGDE